MDTVVLNSTQVFVVGVVTIIVTYLAGLIAEKFLPWFLGWAKIKVGVKIDLGRTIKTFLVIVSAGLLAWWWYPAALPAAPIYFGTFLERVGQFFGFLPQLLTSLSPYVGAAVAIYNVLLTYLLDPDKRRRFLLDANKLLADWRGENKTAAAPK